MVTFTNKFLSVAGQKERLANVGATLKASLTGKGVVADTGSKTVDKVLSAAASNPYTTAGIVAVAAAPKVAVGAVKETVAGLSAKQKAVAAVVAPAAVAVVVSNPKGSAKAVASAPSNIASFGSNVYETLKDPSKENIANIYKDTPVIAGAVTGAAALVAGKAIQAAYYGSEIIGNDTVKLPTEKVKETTIPASNMIQNSKPIEPELVNVTRSVSTGAKRSSSRKTPIFAPSLRVTINNQNKNTKFIKFSKYTA